jgi:hypothetical protein
MSDKKRAVILRIADEIERISWLHDTSHGEDGHGGMLRNCADAMRREAADSELQQRVADLERQMLLLITLLEYRAETWDVARDWHAAEIKANTGRET